MGQTKILNPELRDRFKKARDRSGISIEELSSRLTELLGPSVRGASYGSLRAYASGLVRHPRRDILTAAADVMGVNPEWLISGKGPMTAGAAKARELVEVLPPEIEEEVAKFRLGLVERLARIPEEARPEAFRKEFLETGSWLQEQFRTTVIDLLGGAAGRALFEQLVERIILAQPAESGEPTDEEVHAVAVKMSLLVLQLWDALGPSSGSDTRDYLFNQDVTQALLTAFSAAVARPGQGRPIHEVLKMLPDVPSMPLDAHS
jgi:transcriptional regulator with XRE-family HTH domain